MENEVIVESQELPLIDDIDLASLFEDYTDGFNLDEFDFISTNEQQTPSLFSLFSLEDVEKFLMEGGDEAGVESGGGDLLGDALLADLHADGSGFGFGSGSDSGKSEVDTSESDRSVESEAEKERGDGFVVAVDEEEEREGDDPVSKKQRRQMRNRESAMKSRERKKMYVQELEMKSKYLDSECRRLHYALQCCMAENVALQHRMQKERPERPLGAPAAKQESAVLFMESLLLGSLFWLVSIVCLFLVPSLNLEVESIRLGRDHVLEKRRIQNSSSN